jgi:hypothetical protein
MLAHEQAVASLSPYDPGSGAFWHKIGVEHLKCHKLTGVDNQHMMPFNLNNIIDPRGLANQGFKSSREL